ncbi:hypothetical protein GpartN1_g1155.t1 [Galdieria partita]|uniref:GST N-terminal domain-containing protein n=1 Tax=Galdieria partita TaxID=83374 RepID=A0A9C7PSD2_9RHOD|nr:hypothetical protein GpartN1_g1155.t1 [Galdieria partita]
MIIPCMGFVCPYWSSWKKEIRGIRYTSGYSCPLDRSTTVFSRKGYSCSLDLDIFQEREREGILYSIPVSNYSARCRFVIYAKEIPIEIHSPPAGLKSEEYLKINPLGKVPALWLVDNNITLFESEVINEYLIDKYMHVSPSFIPKTAEKRAIARLSSRIYDLYIGPYQYGLYRDVSMEERKHCLESGRRGLEVLERVIQATPFVAGERISLGDIAVFPSLIFWVYLAPRYYDWYPLEDLPKVSGWFHFMKTESSAAEKVYKEVIEGLETWEKNGRFERMGLKQRIS